MIRAEISACEAIAPGAHRPPYNLTIERGVARVQVAFPADRDTRCRAVRARRLDLNSEPNASLERALLQ
jgi:hypothetical protein